MFDRKSIAVYGGRRMLKCVYACANVKEKFSVTHTLVAFIQLQPVYFSGIVIQNRISPNEK